MDDLVKLMMQQVQITEEQARGAINTMLAYIRNQMPEPMAAQVDAFLQSGGMNTIPGLSDFFRGASEAMRGMSGTEQPRP
jgi:hypothetical protein